MARPTTKLESIDKTAMRLFALKGINQVTIRDIAREAKCSEGALYRHYASKEDMALLLYKRELEKFGSLLKSTLNHEDSFSGRLKSAVVLFYSFFDNDPVTFKFILLSEHHFPPRNKLDPKLNPHNLVFEFVKEGVRRKEFKIGDSELFASVLLGMVLEPATLRTTGRLRGKMRDKASEVAQACLRVLNSEAGGKWE